ncbi:Protein of unknown function (DUF1645 [Striga hermonthica]|uniref:Uncharacterized protein n=1 Tax=Striga hermonthica TaxID=68872 RepID=A0A9N7MHQ8_STRHE|nr:Protein of unknown function (DUF1645 [Striga hermonthica]
MASPPYTYVTAPTSPIPPGLDDFEFETSSKFNSGRHNNNFDPTFFDYYGGQNGKIAFADELFSDGLVMPLKPPPRLHHDSSAASSPTRPATLCRLPFSRKNNNDDFDPFVAALQKVTEEKRRGRVPGPRQRRSRSYSPFRAVVRCSSDCTVYADREFSEESAAQAAGGPSFSGPLLDFKGSAYARWVRDQTGEGGLRPVRNDSARPEDRSFRKVQKLKEFLKKYALFGRMSKGTKTGAEKNKSSKYYAKLGFKAKENGK